MKKICQVSVAVVSVVLFASCNAFKNVSEDAKETPIGSVFTGETTSADSYIKKVSDKNRSVDSDTWRPMSNERF